MYDTSQEWKKMEVKFIQVEEKKKSQIELLRNEIDFRAAPEPPKFFDQEIYKRPVSPIAVRQPYLPPPRSPSPDFDLVRAALMSRPPPPIMSRRSPTPPPPSPPRRARPRSRSRSRSQERSRKRRSRSRGRSRNNSRGRRRDSRDKKRDRSRSRDRKRPPSADSDVIEVSSTAPQPDISAKKANTNSPPRLNLPVKNYQSHRDSQMEVEPAGGDFEIVDSLADLADFSQMYRKARVQMHSLNFPVENFYTGYLEAFVREE